MNGLGELINSHSGIGGTFDFKNGMVIQKI